MAFIEPMHRNKPNITYLLTFVQNIHYEQDALKLILSRLTIPKVVIFRKL